MCEQYFLFCVQEFPPVRITDNTGKVLDEKCKTSACSCIPIYVSYVNCGACLVLQEH